MIQKRFTVDRLTLKSLKSLQILNYYQKRNTITITV